MGDLFNPDNRLTTTVLGLLGGGAFLKALSVLVGRFFDRKIALDTHHHQDSTDFVGRTWSMIEDQKKVILQLEKDLNNQRDLGYEMRLKLAVQENSIVQMRTDLQECCDDKVRLRDENSKLRDRLSDLERQVSEY